MAATIPIKVGFLAWPVVSTFRSAQLVKTVASAATPEKLSATSLLVTTATVFAKKGERTTNTGIVHLGPTSTNNKQPYDLNPGELTVLYNTDLSKWYLDVDTDGDGVVVVYDN